MVRRKMGASGYERALLRSVMLISKYRRHGFWFWNGGFMLITT